SAITNVGVTGTGCTQWAGPSSTLQPGGTADFSCTFTPSTTTPWTAIGHGKDTLGNDVPLTGETTSGPVTAIHPATTWTTKTVTPRTTVAAGTAVTITVTEKNTGDSPITNVSVSGTGCTSFTGGNSTLAPNASTDFSCVFTPGTTTQWSATGHGKDEL